MSSITPFELSEERRVPFYTQQEQTFRNLLGDYVNYSSYRMANQGSNLESPQLNFFTTELMTDFTVERGYTIGSEFHTAKSPGREGTYERTDRVGWRADPTNCTLTEEFILEAKRQGMTIPKLLDQARKDAKQITSTRGFAQLRVITTVGFKFHTWMYDLARDELQSLFSDPELGDEHLDVTDPRASFEWFMFVQSVRRQPNVMAVHSSLILGSNRPSEAA